MQTIKTDFFDYLFVDETQKWFEFLVKSNVHFILCGSHALSFWANQKNLKFRDVKQSDLDVRTLNVEIVKNVLYNWWDNTNFPLYIDFRFIAGKELEYDEDVKLCNLINLEARFMKDVGRGYFCVMDIFSFDTKIDNSYVWIETTEGFKFRLLSEKASLLSKQTMYKNTIESKEKHKKDLEVFGL